MLAAGFRDVGGLGVQAVYGKPSLTYTEFEEAWSMMQTVLMMQSEESRDELRRQRSLERALDLERQGMLQAAVNPFGEGFDPGA